MAARTASTRLLVWRLALLFFALLTVGLTAVLWFSGEQETKNALQEGRRFLITLESGEITGNVSGAAAESPLASGENSTESPSPSSASSPSESQVVIASAEPAKEAPPPPAADIPDPKTIPGVNPSLVEKSAVGLLPIIGKDGTKPWQHYARPIERRGTSPIIAVVVTGLGQNKTVTDAALKLPMGVTLSFTPYAKNASTWAIAARQLGHEILGDIPMEPSNYPAVDPGPYGLLRSKTTQENEARLQWIMSRFQAYVGMISPLNEVYTDDLNSMKSLLQVFDARGIVLVLGREPLKTEVKEAVAASKTKTLVADVLIDEELTSTAIQTRFITLEQIAKKRGYAIGMAQAFPISVEELASWTERMANKGFQLVPLTAIALQGRS